MAGEESPRAARDDGETLPDVAQPPEGHRDVRDPLPPEIRDPSFSTAVRGYDRHAVDAYVERVNRLIAELQISGSPRAAVRHALDRVGEQTSGILQHARQTAEEITASAREEAEQTTGRARAEAEDIIARAGAEAEEVIAAAKAEAEQVRLRARDESDSTVARARIDAETRIRQAEEELGALQEQAEGRMQSLQADIAAVSDERRALIEEIRRIAARLSEVVAEPAAPSDEDPSPETT